MTDPRGYVRRGEPLAIAATQVNWINDQMRNGGISQPPAASIGAPYTWVYGKNSSGSDASRWSVLTITGVEITPTADETATATRQFCQMPALTLGSDTESGKRCVAIEPIKDGTFGRVAIAGAVQVKPDDISKLDGAIELWKNDDWALVRFGGGGDVRLGKTTAAWLRNTSQEIEIWDKGEPLAEEVSDPLKTVTAHNKVYDVASGVWVLVAKASSGEWYLVEAATPDYSESGCRATNVSGHDLTTISGYNEGAVQLLGHDNGCLKWFDVCECEAPPP